MYLQSELPDFSACIYSPTNKTEEWSTPSFEIPIRNQ